MEKNYKIRPVRVEDFVDFIKWWKFYDHCDVPTSDLLPNGGLGGLAIEIDGKVIAGSFMYLTNSAMGYLDFLISDPEYKSKDKYNMIWDLQETCTANLIKQGCRIVWAMTSYDHLAEMAGKIGHDVLEDKYHVMYTHKKVYDDLTKNIENEQDTQQENL